MQRHRTEGLVEWKGTTQARSNRNLRLPRLRHCNIIVYCWSVDMRIMDGHWKWYSAKLSESLSYQINSMKLSAITNKVEDE